MANKTVLNKRSSVVVDGNPKIPTAEQLDYGEFAINYAAGVETLSIKNSENEIVSVLINGTLQTLAESLAMHEARNDNPHGVTKAQVGLSNVDNTVDVDKPVSTLQQAELDKKLNNAENGGVANNLTTNSTEVALSAAQGIILNRKISEMTGGAIEGLQSLENRVAAIEQEISEASAYIDSTLMPKAHSIISYLRNLRNLRNVSWIIL
jgi:hypothetical protein